MDNTGLPPSRPQRDVTMIMSFEEGFMVYSVGNIWAVGYVILIVDMATTFYGIEDAIALS